VRLSEIIDIYETMPQNLKRYLNEMMPLNIEARYPRKKDAVFKLLSKERCEEIIKSTEDFIEWIRKI